MLTNIEAERGRNGYSKESLSRELGITSKTYRSYVNSADMPTSILLRLCDMFECSADYLLERPSTTNVGTQIHLTHDQPERVS